jgi:hemoglobin
VFRRLFHSAVTLALLLATPGVATSQSTLPDEEPVDPYVISNTNAGTDPYRHTRYFDEFGGRAGIDQIVEDFTKRIVADSLIGDIFFAIDEARFRRTLSEQFCYILGGPCDYTGRPMESLHKAHGITQREFNALVENLQRSMTEFKVPFRVQNKLLAKLAPMSSEIISR